MMNRRFFVLVLLVSALLLSPLLLGPGSDTGPSGSTKTAEGGTSPARELAASNKRTALAFLTLAQASLDSKSHSHDSLAEAAGCPKCRRPLIELLLFRTLDESELSEVATALLRNGGDPGLQAVLTSFVTLSPRHDCGLRTDHAELLIRTQRLSETQADSLRTIACESMRHQWRQTEQGKATLKFLRRHEIVEQVCGEWLAEEYLRRNSAGSEESLTELEMLRSPFLDAAFIIDSLNSEEGASVSLEPLLRGAGCFRALLFLARHVSSSLDNDLAESAVECVSIRIRSRGVLESLANDSTAHDRERAIARLALENIDTGRQIARTPKKVN